MDKQRMNDHPLASRQMFRGLGEDVRLANLARDEKWATALCLSLLLLLAWGHWVDTDQQEQDAFFAGMEFGRTEMAETVADAYRQGRFDAAAAADTCSQGPGLDRRIQRVALRDALCAKGQQ